MGRKKRKKDVSYFCYYCNRNFEGEKILIQHQKAKHFKCSNCHKKMVTAFALMNHMFQVHKETLKVVPNAREGRDSVDLHIHGMQGVPEEAKAEKREQNQAVSKKQKTEEEEYEEVSAEEEEVKAPTPAAKPAPTPTPAVTPQAAAPYGGQMFPGMQMPGMPPGFNPMMMGMNPMAMGRGFPMPMGRGMPMPGMPFMPGMMPGMPIPPMMQGMPPQPSPPQKQPPTPALAQLQQAPPAQTQPEGKTTSGKGSAIFIFQDELSMEELRAQLPKHRFDPNQSSNSTLSSLSQSIAQRMADLKKKASR